MTPPRELSRDLRLLLRNPIVKHDKKLSILNAVFQGKVSDLLLRFLRWPLLLGAVTVFLACLYRYGPCRAKPRWRWVSWGGAFAALAWLLGSAAFSWYVGDLGGGGKAYGSWDWSYAGIWVTA